MRTQLKITGEGPPLVIVGGGLTGINSFLPHAELLESRRRVALAQPLSVQLGLERANLPADYSIKLESRSLLAALDELGWVQPIDVIGWSYGGHIAFDFALDHPGRIRSLVLVEPDGAWLLPDYGRADPAVRKAEEDAVRWADGVSEDELVTFLSEMLGPDQPPREHPRWPEWNRFREALRGVIAVYRHRDDPARVARFSRPVLVIRGEGTDAYNVAVTNTLTRMLPNARLVELPGGHMTLVVSMERFLAEVEAFLAGAEPR
jgi:pimeloyl-ACP methyl ester carboxylesterase